MSLTCLAASCPQTLASLPIWHLTYRGQAYLQFLNTFRESNCITMFNHFK
jgi:hypothetical protein